MGALKILVGADPELFLRNKKGEFVSAHDILPGTKMEPFDIHKEGANGAIQVDGAAAEFNIDPAKSSLSFINNIDQVMTNLRTKTKDLELVLNPYVAFEPTYFKSLPDNVKELGCNPDWNAYTGDINPAPEGDKTTIRTASGHIHIGWTKNVNPQDPNHFEDCITIIKQMDYYLGLYSLLWDPDNTRRQLYGKAGAFRPKPYGVEYRVMSNVWLRSQSVQAWIFNAVIAGVKAVTHNKKLFDTLGEYARECIDNNVIDWHTSTKGKTIMGLTGMSWPDFRSCLDKPAPTNVVNKKKTNHEHNLALDKIVENIKTKKSVWYDQPIPSALDWNVHNDGT